MNVTSTRVSFKSLKDGNGLTVEMWSADTDVIRVKCEEILRKLYADSIGRARFLSFCTTSHKGSV